MTTGPIVLGVSRCLLGDAVRYDGGHKRNALLLDRFAPYVQWVAVCPEVEVGMGTPREPIDLETTAAGVRLVGVASRRDWTEAMTEWSARRIAELSALNLSGFVLKSGSPSCGVGRGGLFARALTAALPQLPVEEESALADPLIRDGFVERVFAYARLTRFFSSSWSQAGLVAFHTAHKMQLLAHSRARYGELGELVAAGRAMPREALSARYVELFMAALREPTSRGRHADVLQHMAGHLKDRLDAPARERIHLAIEQQRLGEVELEVPLALIREQARHHAIDYLDSQTYLNPDSRERQLRG